MSLSKLFQIFNSDSVEDNEHYIVLDDFFNFLKKQDGDVKCSNVNRSFRRFKGGIKTLNNKQVVSVNSILKFIFSYCDTLSSCASLAKNIEKYILGDKKSDDIGIVNSLLDIYKLIAKTKFPNLNLLFNKVIFDESNIITLVPEHKVEFTAEEWRKICWFEKHFSNTLDSFDIEYDEIIRLKFRQFQSLRSIQECNENWTNTLKKQIKLKTLRIEAAESLNQSEIDAAQKHIPAVIERHLWSVVREDQIDEILGIAVFDSKDSIQNNVIHGVLEIRSIDLLKNKEEICQSLYYSLKRKHNVQLGKVLFFGSGSLSEFKSGDIIHRFHLRDSVLNGSILDKCIESWNADELMSSEITDDEESKCPSCFDPGLPKPLSSKGFRILEEWYLETPIETQILFDGFINRDSWRRSSKSEDYLHQKFEKLYLVYDILLNVYNKKFIGVLQQANTQELLTEYKSISSVFDVTSSAGATTSLVAAEKKLKMRSDQDLCYFNTYLKRHKLIYDTVMGDCEKEVSLRECHLVLLLDNLVKWTNKKVTTAKRSETMTNLMCTLPITLQGLPEDSGITEQWHTDECDGSANCICKQSVVLTKADIDDVLINLSQNEQNVYQQFGNLMAWGYNQLWAKMTDEVLVHVELGQHGSALVTSEALAADSELSSQETVETSESSEPFEEELDLTQILTSVTDTVSKDDDSMLFRNDFELSDIDEQFNLENTHTIQNPDDDVSHQDINDSFEDNEPCSGNSSQHSNNSDPEDEVMETMDKSFHNLSLHETPEMSPETLLATFGFEKFVVPPLLSRHPPPATGRDDDVMKIKEIMDDTITKMGYENDESTMRNRILSGPDHKIGKCMLSLINSDKKYERFLLEFPLLHLRKSKITILFSAYSEAGLVQLLQYMRDNDQTNWESLMSAQHIDTATRYVKRVSLSLHLAFMVVFARSLENKDLENYIYDLETLEPKEISEKWGEKFEEFLEKGSKKNATFALHRDMMTHCDEVIAIALAERLGGPAGHALLRAAVKRSLPFVFLNGASSYAPYCVKLLYHHQSAGRFYKNLKQTLYSTPFKTSKKNFACDTKRELDHLDAIKGFRSGSTVASATVRMSLIDSLNEIRFDKHGSKSTTNHDTDNLGWVLTEVDESHIFPTAGLILRQNGLSLDANDVPVNVYAKIPTALPVTILDDYSYETGTFLMLRNVAKEKLFQLSGEQEIQNRLNLTGQSELVSRAKRSKGVTIRRTVKSKIITYKSERQLKEQERKKIVAKETKIIECLSSENNACQALVKPDSSKPKVIKSIGMQRAIKDVLIQSLDTLNESHNINIRPDNLLQLNVPSVPKEVSLKVKMCITEFAGIKFKTGNLKTGKEYLHFVESTVIKGMTRLAPNASTIIICEEKYGYTPDDLKAGTREQRQEKTDKSVTHLKSVSSLLNDENFNKAALTKTLEGKTLISTYLAKNIDALSIDKQVELVIDSQLVESTCSCDIEMCMCSKFCTPLARKFETGKHFQAVQLTSIRQRKGEAEMSQLDWLLNLQHTLSEGDVALSLVTSGDVDAIYIHLFVISQFWERRQDNTFRFPVYIVLQKPQSKLDVYNITGVLEVFEKVYQDRQIGIKLAVALCMGGNDFVPKCYQISHGTILKLALQTEYRANLLNFEDNRLKMNMDVYVDFMKTLYCPKRIRSNTMSFSDVRAATIRKSADPVQQSGYKTADPRRWLPPESAVRNLGELIQLQIAYLETAGHHSAEMPNFLSSSCLKKTQTGEIENYFGPESHFSSVQDLPLPKKISSVLKRQQNVTPQKGHRKKRAMLTSTPKTKR